MCIDSFNIYLVNPYDVKIGRFISEQTNEVHDLMYKAANSSDYADRCRARLLCPSYILMNILQPPLSTISITAEATLKGLANILAIPCTMKGHRVKRCEAAWYTLVWGSIVIPIIGACEYPFGLAFRVPTSTLIHPCFPNLSIMLNRPPEKQD